MKAYKLIAIILAGLFLLCACEKQETPPADNPSESNPAPSDTIEPTTEATEELTEEPIKLPSITFEIEQIGTYENIEEEFAGYQIYRTNLGGISTEDENNQWLQLKDDSLQALYAKKPFRCAVIYTDLDNAGNIYERPITEEENVEFTRLYVFGKIFNTWIDNSHNAQLYWTHAGAGFYATKEIIILNSARESEAYLIYENGYQKIWADEKNHTIGTEATRNLYFSIDDEVITYYRYNAAYVSNFGEYDGHMCGYHQGGSRIFEDLSDEEIAAEFMLEYGTIALIDGIPELQPIQTYTIKEWSHSEFSPYAQQLIEYNCEINELWNILNNK